MFYHIPALLYIYITIYLYTYYLSIFVACVRYLYRKIHQGWQILPGFFFPAFPWFSIPRLRSLGRKALCATSTLWTYLPASGSDDVEMPINIIHGSSQQKLLYFEWSPPWHFKTACWHHFCLKLLSRDFCPTNYPNHLFHLAGHCTGQTVKQDINMSVDHVK